MVGVMVSRLRLPLRHVLFLRTGMFLRDFDIMIRAHCGFGLGNKCIHGTTLKYTKVKRDSIKLTRGGFRFLPPLSPSSSSMIVDVGTYGMWFAVAFSCSTVLIIVVVALRLATVS